MSARITTSEPAAIPASVKALTRARPFIPTAAVSPFPLRCFDGRTWAQRAADLKKDQAA